MKKTYNIIIVLLFALVACNDKFLERMPLDKISDSNFWKTGADVQMYANQFYPLLFDARLAWYNLDNYSDNQTPSSHNIYTFGEYSVPSSGGGWSKADWKPIRDCNYALERIANMTPDASLLQAQSEILFFKTFFYFLKVKKFGDVPWLTKSLTPESPELTAAREPRGTVIANMLKDIDFAITNLPQTSADDRLTKYAALALKGDICLYEGTFMKYHNLSGNNEDLLRNAATAYEGIINSGLFSVYSTGHPESDYFNLFVQYELKGNPEGIMVQRYITNVRMHNNVRQLGEPYTGYNQSFVQSYLCTDGLPIGVSPLYKGDAAFADAFENRDPRMKQSIYNTARPYNIADNGAIYYKTMPEFQSNYCPTSYFIIKGYSPYEKDRLPSTSITDDFIYRYGDILVSYAEAKAELGECTQEVLDKSVNLLRDRVDMPHLEVNVGFVDPNWPDWEVPVTPLINEIRRERRIETCAEGSRWDDLVRWRAGKLLESELTLEGARDPATGDYRKIYPGSAPRKWNDKLYLYPIPTQELALNSNLVQNPGWK